MILDDSYSSAPNGTFDLRDASSRVEIAQHFVPSVTNDIATVTLKLEKVGSPTGNVFVKIYSDSASAPGSLLVTSANVDVSTLAGSATDVDFTFALGTVLSSGVSYWLSIGGDYTVSAVNLARVSVRTPNYRSDALKYDGANWSVVLSTYSLYFLEYYTDSSASASASSSVSASASSSASKSLSPSASLSPSGSQSPSPSASQSPSSSISPSLSPSSSASRSLSQSSSVSASSSSSVSPSPSPSISPSESPSLSPSASPSLAVYIDKYSTTGNSYTSKYSDSGSTYVPKYNEF